MDYETRDDDRPTDRADDLESGDEAADPGAFSHESVFEAPDLATAFLAALDAVDDRAYVAPLLDPVAEPEPASPPASASTAPSDIPAPSTQDAAPLEPGTLALVEQTPDAAHDPLDTVSDPSATLYGVPSPFAYVIEHEDPIPAPPPVTRAPAADAAAEAFAREQAEAAAIEAAIQAEIEAEKAAASRTNLVLETVSNQDSYYDPDTLRLTRPLFSPDEPRAFAGPVYVGDSAAAHADADLHAATADGDAEAEVLEDLEEFVAFSLGETRCVVPIRNVIEIGRIPDAVGVPNAPAWLHGLGNLRGQVISLIDLRAFLGIGRVRPATGRMLVLRTDDDEVHAGLLVDHVHQIVSLSASRFSRVPETLPQHYARHAWGVCDYGNFTMIGLEVDDLLGLESMAAERAETL